MKLTGIIMALLCLISSHLLAQAPTPHSTPESRQRAKDRADYSLFRRQVTALKEYAEERKKIPALQKENKELVKVYVTVDSADSDDTTKNKIITGYITQQIGESTNNAYEITFDRATRKILNVKRTGESADPEPAEEKEKKAPVVKKAEGGKAPVAKKKKGDDEDDEEEEEKEEKTPAGKEKDD